MRVRMGTLQVARLYSLAFDLWNHYQPPTIPVHENWCKLEQLSWLSDPEIVVWVSKTRCFPHLWLWVFGFSHRSTSFVEAMDDMVFALKKEQADEVRKLGFTFCQKGSKMGWPNPGVLFFETWFLRKCRAKIRWRVETQPRPKLEVKQKDFCVEEFRKNQLQTEDKTRPDAQRFLLTLTVTHVTQHFCSGSWRLHCHWAMTQKTLIICFLPERHYEYLWVVLPWSNANDVRMSCLGLKTTRMFWPKNQGQRARRNIFFWYFWCDESILY